MNINKYLKVIKKEPDLFIYHLTDDLVYFYAPLN